MMTAAIALTLALPAAAQSADPVPQGEPNVPEFTPAFPEQTRAPASDSGVSIAMDTIAEGLNHPWGIAVLPEGGYLVTERSGQLRVIAADGSLSEQLTGVPEVHDVDQGGLLDVVLAPDFAESRVIYMSYAKPMEDGMSATAAARAVLAEDLSGISEVSDIFVQDPPSASSKHYGSRVIPTEDWVFVTMGEHSIPAERVYAQDLDKTYGKIVRVTPEGEALADNPFQGQEGALPEIWTYGHRNIQGAALRPGTDQLWSIEHGPAGGDELNLIEPGNNYGWPVVSYGENYSGTPVGTGQADHAGNGFVEPRYYWDPVIAPGGMIFYQGEMFADWEGDVLASSLYPGALVRLELDGDTVVGEERLITDLGRIRDVEVDADGSLLVLIDEERGSVVRLTRE
ncbi:PQQ-dependent sugar dehydrogenase [Roseobacter sp. HKCCA0434]|uniref:PQQ-dependent sugar dehydrogenase n=1 Tax=Roseobacter sp. HKCCA0434 TaxID=3079297 RepID=UPI002905A1E6|nr:PQQ-dependent sugar dehydrogenase [Roseobacter sp. HKCCA0434]